ncbi:MAG: NAD(P)-binding protein [Myxococcota bacterium]
MDTVDTVILGAGISGLATAAAIGKGADLIVLERDAEIGGYCKTVKQDGFVWDYSGHFFHFKRPDIEAWLRARMPGQEIRTVVKKSFIAYAGRQIDFPFQKNIHQLPQDEFIDCLHDLYFARAPGQPPQPEGNFKEMLYARFGRSIAEKFLIPYNEKLYATDLATLDRDAMGRFFPHADLTEIIRNMKQPDNASYNATFTYPAGGAIEYVKALASEVDPSAIHLGEGAQAVDLEKRAVRTARGEYRFNRLVTSAPFPALLKLCGLPVDDTWTWNQVLVFNFGFDAKGPRDVHWVYFPDRTLPFYRVGFYDNIFDGPRMSLYVEVGLPRDAPIDVAKTRDRVLAGLEREGIVTTQRLVSEHSVVMNPAYVHITKKSNAEVARWKAQLEARGIHSIGRYGSWTYCSIEDNIVEARALATRLGVAEAWPLEA